MEGRDPERVYKKVVNEGKRVRLFDIKTKTKKSS